ncbi:MAG: hypothetical protein IPM38_00095 [Ignavibacteria bacterium]|nr:hypothetical protein [Ignavibacteria bacterium]
MKKFILLSITFLIPQLTFSQIGNSPYPVIFVHGLNSDDMTWNTTVNQLSASWIISAEHNLSAVLNARGGDTTEYTQDVVIPLLNTSGAEVNKITNSNIYTVNFGNFWNRDGNDPRIILYNNSLPGSNQNPSNQSAIFKQGFALKIFIDSVLRITGADKVILAGHSMGGLAIREYLQRRENGIHKWWIDPNDTLNGHKVVKVITIGTPHLGTNVSIPIGGIDFNSEAIRDMKNSFTGSNSAGYLFGNPESLVPSNYYNKDFNCNGIQTDTATGLNSGTADNPAMPLPQNILYTWIMSNYLGLGTDLAAPYSSQEIYNGSVFAPAGAADTIRTNKNHIQETSDSRSLIRALDEPDNQNTAYDISFSKLYSGFITLQSRSVTSDTDYYKVNSVTGGKITVTLNSLNAGVNGISILSGDGASIISKTITSSPDSVSFYSSPGNYFIRMTGNSNQNPNLNSYKFTAVIIPSPALNLTLGIEGFRNETFQTEDTVKVYLMENTSPYDIIDSAVVFLNDSGKASVYFLSAETGNYYIKIIHRNALETWSFQPVTFTGNEITDFDFTSEQEKAYGNNQILKSGKWCIYSGDTDRDGIIDVSDQSQIENDVFNVTTGYVITDLTGDLIVDLTDASIADNNGLNFIYAVIP